ncbi:MAG: glycosyltransferase [Sphingomonadales bacterium]
MIEKKTIHIVCPEAPWPLTSGSRIDMFYRIRCLHDAGLTILLHYFSASEGLHPTELNPYCKAIYIYPLEKGRSRQWPESIRLRSHPALLARLQEDHHPILLEGLSCCGHLTALCGSQRKILVRIQQLRHRHLQEKGTQTRNPLLWLRWFIERKKLLHIKRHLPAGVRYACSNEEQATYYREKLGMPDTVVLPVFSPYTEVRAKEGVGSFCLFQGDLSEKETEKMLVWLLTKVFSRVSIPFVIAGHHPSSRIEKLVHLYQHTCLVANPGEAELDDLIQKAQTNVLPSSVSAGTSLRLLHALALGKHCICNAKALKNSTLKEACYSAETATGIASLITQLQHRPFGQEEITLRKKLLKENFDTTKSTAALIEYLV